MSATRRSHKPRALKPTLRDFLGQEDVSLYTRIVDTIGDELILINRDGRIIYANDAAVRGLGASRQELSRSLITDFMKDRMPIDRWQRQAFQELRRIKKPLSYQLERVNKRGKRQTIQATAVYVKLQDQELILSVAHDITEQVRLQNELQETLHYYHQMLDEGGDPILIFDLAGRVTFVNKVAEEAFGYPAKKFKGKHFKDFVLPQYRARVWTAFQRAKKAVPQRGVEVETRNARRERIPWEVTFAAVEKDGEVVAIHTIGRDLRPRRQLQNLMIETEKLKAVQFFVAGMAFELRNPLLGVLKKTDELMGRYRGKAFEYIGYREFTDIMRTIQGIKNQLEYCYRTTDRLVNVNLKRVKLKKTSCQPNLLLEEMIKLRETDFLAKDIKIKLQLEKDLPRIAIGEIDFEQIVNNLINNSIESMLGGGVLKITTIFLKKSGKVQLACEDSGVGIPPEQLAHIYEPFFTTKERGVNRNSGLGLTIVYSLMRACHGSIQIESSLSKGTTVTLMFPVRRKNGRAPGKMRAAS